MKYGLLYDADAANIGDDIQSYAASRFLPRIDYFVDRDHMDLFRSENAERVAVIFNAWFWSAHGHWPPANSILPLLISMHFSTADDSEGLGYGLSVLGGLGGDWLRHFGPVGCRDCGTLDIMKARDIPAWYSGCITLTLPNRPQIQQSAPYVCLVDIDPAAEAFARARAAEAGYGAEVLTHAVTPLGDWPRRVERLEAYLQKYRNARCVVTTRLHCALPCLAMGVPVLYLCDDAREYRISNFLEHLHTAATADFCAGRAAFSVADPPPNKNTHLPLREKLIETAQEFIRRCEAGEPGDAPMFAATELERQKWKTRLAEDRLRVAYGDHAKTREELYLLRSQVCRSGFDARLSVRRLLFSVVVQFRALLFKKSDPFAARND